MNVAQADSLYTVRVYTFGELWKQVGQTIVFCGLSGSSSNGDRRHKPIVCPTSDLADSTRMYKLKAPTLMWALVPQMRLEIQAGLMLQVFTLVK